MTASPRPDLNSQTEEVRIITTLRWIYRTSSAQPADSRTVLDDLRRQLDGASIAHHRQRLLEAAEALRWERPTDFLRSDECEAELIRKLNHHVNDQQSAQGITALKVRVSISSTNQMSIETSPITVTNASMPHLYPFTFSQNLSPSTSINCTVYLASTALKESIFTRYKTTRRQHYDELREASNISHLPPTTAEVLLWNPSNEIMEASLSTVYFVRNTLLVTPDALSGGHNGVSKRMALKDPRCREGVIKTSELVEGDLIWLSNAVRGFWPAILTLKTKYEED